MRMSFGKPIGTAAQIQVGQRIMTIRVNSNGIPRAKKAFKAASYKMPTPVSIIVEKLPA